MQNIQNKRIIHKHDIEANWIKAKNFIPFKGEIIIYDKDENHDRPRFKIGDGETTVNSLPFIAEVCWKVEACEEDIYYWTEYLEEPVSATDHLIPNDIVIEDSVASAEIITDNTDEKVFWVEFTEDFIVDGKTFKSGVFWFCVKRSNMLYLAVSPDPIIHYDCIIPNDIIDMDSIDRDMEGHLTVNRGGIMEGYGEFYEGDMFGYTKLTSEKYTLTSEPAGPFDGQIVEGAFTETGEQVYSVTTTEKKTTKYVISPDITSLEVFDVIIPDDIIDKESIYADAGGGFGEYDAVYGETVYWVTLTKNLYVNGEVWSYEGDEVPFVIREEEVTTVLYYYAILTTNESFNKLKEYADNKVANEVAKVAEHTNIGWKVDTEELYYLVNEGYEVTDTIFPSEYLDRESMYLDSEYGSGEYTRGTGEEVYWVRPTEDVYHENGVDVLYYQDTEYAVVIRLKCTPTDEIVENAKGRLLEDKFTDIDEQVYIIDSKIEYYLLDWDENGYTYISEPRIKLPDWKPVNAWEEGMVISGRDENGDEIYILQWEVCFDKDWTDLRGVTHKAGDYIACTPIPTEPVYYTKLNTSKSLNKLKSYQVGSRTDNNGEIFNDYDNNEAISNYSIATGSGTIAGLHGWLIEGYNEEETINTIDIYHDAKVDVVIGDKLSLILTSNYWDIYTITQIEDAYDGQTIRLFLEGTQSLEQLNWDTQNELNYICILAKPNWGNIDLGLYAHAEGYGSQAAYWSAHAEGMDTKALAQHSHTEGRLTQATGVSAHAEGLRSIASGSQAHAEGRDTVASGLYGAHAEGYKSQAIGNQSHAEGQSTQAVGGSSHAEGKQTQANGSQSHAEGYLTIAGKTNSHAEGLGSEALGEQSHAEGHYSKAEGTNTHAEGESTRARFRASHAEGTSTTTFGESSHAEGNKTTAFGAGAHSSGGSYQSAEEVGVTFDSTVEQITSLWGENDVDYRFNIAAGSNSHTEGFNTLAAGQGSHAEGRGTKASGGYAHAEGSVTIASGGDAHAEGMQSKASGGYSHAEGGKTLASGEGAHSEGFQTQAIAANSHAEGRETVAGSDYAHAEGDGTESLGIASHTEGKETLTEADYAHAEGYQSWATGAQSHAEGRYTAANGASSHTEGINTTTHGNGSHAEGYSTNSALDLGVFPESTIADIETAWSSNKFALAKGSSSHMEGQNGLALGEASHVEGANNKASGTSSHAEGRATIASGTHAHAEGFQSVASNTASHAEGYKTKASGIYSHAEGDQTTASGNYSHAAGLFTQATSECQMAIGKYNKTNTDALFIVGNGTKTVARNNAFEVLKDGTANLNNLPVANYGYGGLIQFGTYDTPAEALEAGEITEECKIYIKVQ